MGTSSFFNNLKKLTCQYSGTNKVENDNIYRETLVD